MAPLFHLLFSLSPLFLLCSLSFSLSLPVPVSEQTCLRFDPDTTVWVAKQQILCCLTQPLRDVLNYGLFQPAVEGRQSGFLDEERLLRSYPSPTCKGVPTLEVSHPNLHPP